MFAGHLPEVIIILVIALIFLGPKRLPEAGSSIGKAIREFRHETQNPSDDEPNVHDVPTVSKEQPQVPPPIVEAAVAEPQTAAAQSTSDNGHPQA